MLYRTKFSFNFATIGCCNQWMQYLQLRVVLLYCNQIIAGITIVWLQQLKVANIATIYCTSVALWLQIFAVCCEKMFCSKMMAAAFFTSTVSINRQSFISFFAHKNVRIQLILVRTWWFFEKMLALNLFNHWNNKYYEKFRRFYDKIKLL